MSPEPRTWKWTNQTEEAAELVARDDLTDQQIADRIGVTKRTLERWKRDLVFASRVRLLTAEFRVRVRERGIAVIEERVNRQDITRRELLQIVEERKQAALAQKLFHEELRTRLLPLYDQRADLRKRKSAIDKDKKCRLEPDEMAEADEAALVEELNRVSDEISTLEHLDPGPIQPGQLTGHLIEKVTHTKHGRIVEWVEDLALLAELRALELHAAKELGQWTDNIRHSGGLGIGFVDLSRVPSEDLDVMEQILEKATPIAGDGPL